MTVTKILGLTYTLAERIIVTADIERRMVSITINNTTLFEKDNFEKFIIQIITDDKNGLIPGNRKFQKFCFVTRSIALGRQN